jgi:hypothetical protein
LEIKETKKQKKETIMKNPLLAALAVIFTFSVSIMSSTTVAQDCIPEEALPVPLPPDFPLPPGGICPGPDFPLPEEGLLRPPSEEEKPPFEEEKPPFEEELPEPPLDEELDGPPFEEEIAEEEVPSFDLDDIVFPEDAAPSEEITDGVGVVAGQLPEGVSPEALGELDAEAISGLTGDALGSFSSDQIADLDAAAVGGLSADQLESFAPGAFAGFDANQVAGFDASAVAGLDATKVAAMDAAAMAGFDATQVAEFDAAAIGGFDKDKVAAMDAAAMAGFDATQVAGFDPAAIGGFDRDKVAAMDGAAMAGFDAAQVAGFDPAAIGGFDKDKVAAMDDAAMAGFDAAQVAGFDPAAISGFDKDKVAAMDAAAMAGFDATQVAGFDAAAMAGFDKDKVAAMDDSAMAGFEAEQLSELPAAAFKGLDSEKMSNLDRKALSGISPDQFAAIDNSALGGLNSENLGGISPDVFNSMSEEEFASLDPSAVREMKGEDFSKLVTNLNEFSVEQDTVAARLPEGWTMDETGALKAPPGAGISLPSLPRPDYYAPKVPAQPDLSTDLALGGGIGTNRVLSGMDSALESANINGLGFTQTSDGILNVGGDDGPAAAAFITDAANMVQASEDAQPGISVDEETGGYVVITEQGYQIPLKPAVANPTEIAALLPDSELEIGEGGQTSISNLIGEDGEASTVTGIPNPILEQSELPAGTYSSGTGADAEIKIVYADGTAQTLTPAIKDQRGFEEAAASIPGVENFVQKVDGSITLTFDGTPIVLRPLFDVVEGGEGTEKDPKIIQEGRKFFFYSAQGSRQEFVVARRR